MRHSFGFNLIELLITLSILSLLVGLSLPLYSTYLSQTRRLQAEAILQKLAIAVEQYQLTGNPLSDVSLAKLEFPEFIVAQHYQLKILVITNAEYELQAIPLLAQAKQDAHCATLILKSSGEKAVTGDRAVHECW